MKRCIAILLVSLFLCTAGCQPKEPATKLNGVEISEYTLIYAQEGPDYCLRAAEYMQQQILARTGITVPVCEAGCGTYPHEIVVGETSRPISQQLEAPSQTLKFAILADENHIALEGEYFVIAAAAYYFVQTYIPGASFDSQIPKTVTIQEPIQEKANNYIFLIGDGMGANQTKMFDFFRVPEDVAYYDGENVFYGYYMPYQGMIHTSSLSGTTDSAAAATALACGYKTINGYVGKDAEGNDLQSLTELAVTQGKSAAVLSTDLMTGATPAGFSAHAMDRDDSDTILSCVQEKMAGGIIIQCGLHATKNYQDKITETLEKLEANPNGFFLMYEEGYIDKFAHKMDAEGTFSSLIRFNQAIGIFMEYAFYHPDTFLIITADHETGGLQQNGEGKMTFTTEEHTAVDVPIFGYGMGAEVFQDYEQENNQIPKVIAALWGVSNFGDPE